MNHEGNVLFQQGSDKLTRLQGGADDSTTEFLAAEARGKTSGRVEHHLHAQRARLRWRKVHHCSAGGASVNLTDGNFGGGQGSAHRL